MDYEKLTDTEFDRILAEVIDEDNQKASNLLSIPGIYEILSEHYNNEVLSVWEGKED